MPGEERRFLITLETITGIAFLQCLGCGAILVKGDEVMRIVFGTEAPLRMHEHCGVQFRDALDGWFSEGGPERMN